MPDDYSLLSYRVGQLSTSKVEADRSLLHNVDAWELRGKAAQAPPEADCRADHNDFFIP